VQDFDLTWTKITAKITDGLENGLFSGKEAGKGVDGIAAFHGFRLFRLGKRAQKKRIIHIAGNSVQPIFAKKVGSDSPYFHLSG